MIFVTVGTHWYEELVQAIDQAAGDGRLGDEVVMQIGTGVYEPSRCEYFRSSPSLDHYYSRADLVIGHGGTGTTLEVMQKGLPLISVANPHMQDNHQHEFLEAMEKLGYLIYCRNLSSIPDHVRTIREGWLPPTKRFGHFYAVVARDLEEWRPAREPNLWGFRSLARRVRGGRGLAGGEGTRS